MRKTAAQRHFKTNAAISLALGISVQAVGKWGRTVPYISALRLNDLTDGELKLVRGDYDHHGRVKAA